MRIGALDVVAGLETTERLRVGARARLVHRTRLLEELRTTTEVPVVLVLGGAGFGKTTLVSQWLADDHRSVAWLNASRQHDDPAVLLADIVRVLDEFEPLEPRTKRQLAAVTIDFSSVLVPRLERTIAERARPFVLVIDDAHRLRRRAVWALVQALADCVPSGSQLVLVSRSEPDLALGRMRADRRVHTLSGASLAMDRGEALQMLEASGVSLSATMVDRLWERTEGWPVGLYLAGLALAEDGDAEKAAAEFAGDDRLVVDYVREELLSVVPRRMRDFLVRASVLEVLDAQTCDAVLARDDSAKLLAEAGRSLQLLIPLDRRGARYRMHQLMRDTMRAELRRREPEAERLLHERAATWYEESGDVGRFVEHLLLAADWERLEGAIWRVSPLLISDGRTATVERWLEGLTEEQLSRRPSFVVTKAWCAFTEGNMPALRHWASVATEIDGDGELPDGSPVAAAAALLRALVGGDGIEATRADAALAYELDRVGSPYRAVARYIEGGTLAILGRNVEARERLEEGEMLGAMTSPAAQAQCLGQLAALAVDNDDWEAAEGLVRRLDAIIERFGLGERPAMGVSLAIAALVHAQRGQAVEARSEGKHALFLLSMLATVAPWISIEARIFLARTFLLLGDVGLARVLTHEATELLVLIPDGEVLEAKLAALEQLTEAEHVPLGVLATPMTPAEMRVLRYLPTHLTFAAIADELFVSRNTVKTQAISIYRKLGVSSRDPAVVTARSLGLLER